jgi:propionyl-CoA carboxylase beta chain
MPFGLLLDLAQRKEKIKSGGGEEKIKKQHSLYKLTARERIEILLDPCSFEEYGMFVKHDCKNFDLDKQHLPCDGVITGYGTIFGRPVLVYSQDFTVAGGSLGRMHANKIVALQKKSIDSGIPIIAINDSGGARIQEGIDALSGYGDVFQNNIIASGVVPQISIIMGPCAGGAVYSPALTDFTIMVRGSSYMFLTGPSVVRSVTNEIVDNETLGGAEMHSKKSGVADLVYGNDIEALMQTRRLFSYLPLSNRDNNFHINSNDDPERKEMSLDNIIPSDAAKAYNMKEIIYKIIDNNDFFEIQPFYAKNIIIGFARINGKTIGIVANQPLEMAGCLDIDASRKAARFVRFCDAFSIPIVTLVDVPGFLPGSAQEHNSIIKHGAKLLYAYGEATIPKITVVTRKSYGGAYIVMSSKHLGGDINYAWPTAEIAVLGSKAACELLFKNSSESEYNQKIKEYEEKFSNPYYAASRGYIDSIIKPRDTREMIYRSLCLLSNKSQNKMPYKKHDNLPL